MQVYPGCVCGEFRVAGRDRLHDEQVLRGRGGQACRIVDGEAANPHEVRAQAAQRGGQVGIVNRRIDGIVEPGDEFIVRMAGRIVVVD